MSCILCDYKLAGVEQLPWFGKIFHFSLTGELSQILLIPD
jgi:hypothetical protein